MAQNQNCYDVCIVGGGASGLFTALCLSNFSKSHLKIAVVEKNDRVGKKLLTTGNGRCNITNMNVSIDDYNTSGDKNIVNDIIIKYPPTKIVKYFSKIGVECYVSEEGRVYPCSQQASSVVEMLHLALQNYNVDEITLFETSKIEKEKGLFIIHSVDNKQPLLCKKIVLATGSNSGLKGNYQNSGYKLAQSLGHTKSPLFPSLVQIKSTENRCKSLKGMKCNAVATVICNNKKIHSKNGISSAQGEVQFTEYGLSGICIFQLSRLVSSYYIDGNKPKQKLEISLDLMQDYTIEQTEKKLLQRRDNLSQIQLENFFTGLFNKRIGQDILKITVSDVFKRYVKDLTDVEIKKLANAIKNYKFDVTGVMSFVNSQVTAGGIKLDEVDSNSLQSKKCKGLFLCGELLDVDGYCGGYNLQWAFASGLAIANGLLGNIV